MNDFYLYNSMTGKKEKFIPIEKDKVRLYTCGPTVYNYAHIGNLRTYIFEDILKKSLEYCGYKVKHVINVTDVGHLVSDGDEGEDKMQLSAERENKNPWEIAKFYEKAFFGDWKKLNIKSPDVIARATEHIDDMIKLIKVLEDKGYTYISNGNVYFEIDKFPDYGRLAKLNLDELKSKSRVDRDNSKINPFDFVLWFTNSKYTNHIMKWDSPWGTGFPGWHIECSAMSTKYLGENIDIHCGGIDHLTVHHNNEIAQSEAALGHKWVNYWMHGEYLVVDGKKMSKSSNDFLTLDKLESMGINPLVYRYFCLEARYRKQLMFSFDAIKDSMNSYMSLKNKIASIKEINRDEYALNEANINSYMEKFKEQISDDLNIPNAITVLYDVIKDSSLNPKEKLFIIEDFDKVLSLDLLNEDYNKSESIDKGYIEELIAKRNEARKNKDWKEADRIRDELLKMKVEIKDTREGTKWTIQ